MPPLVDKLHVARSRQGPDAAVKVVVVQASQAPQPEVRSREWKLGSLERVRASKWYENLVRVLGRSRPALSCMADGQVALRGRKAAISTYSW